MYTRILGIHSNLYVSVIYNQMSQVLARVHKFEISIGLHYSVVREERELLYHSSTVPIQRDSDRGQSLTWHLKCISHHSLPLLIPGYVVFMSSSV